MRLLPAATSAPATARFFAIGARMMSACLLALFAEAGPAHGQISVRSSLSHDLNLAPGQSRSGEIRVRNDTAEPQQARIYQTDYLFYADGTNRYGAPGSAPRSNAAWLQFTPPVLTIPPGEALAFEYTVTVPSRTGSGNPPRGTYWSMLMVEPVPDESATSTLRGGGASGEAQMGIRQVTRYGIQIATHVSGGAPEVALENVRLARDGDGRKLLLVDVKNTGTAMMQPAVWAEVYGADGSEKGRFEAAGHRIYPGTSVRKRIDLSELAAGTYQTLVVVEAEGQEAVGAQYELEL